MPASMFIYDGTVRKTGHTSTCRETSASTVQNMAATCKCITTEMGCNIGKDVVIPILERLLGELSTRFPGIVATVTYVKSAQWHDNLIVSITWTDPKLVALYWWWATALQRIVLYSRDTALYTDIRAALHNSSGINSELWTSTSAKTGTLIVWDALLAETVTLDELSAGMSGTARGPVQAYSWVSMRRAL